jgi:hypothetical protein
MIHPKERYSFNGLSAPSRRAISCVAMTCSFIVAGLIYFANVRDHRHRTAGATDAGEERASASGVTAGRCSVHRFVRSLVPSTLDVEPWSASPSSFLFPRRTVESRWASFAGSRFTRSFVPSHRAVCPRVFRPELAPALYPYSSSGKSSGKRFLRTSRILRVSARISLSHARIQMIASNEPMPIPVILVKPQGDAFY